MNTEQYVAMTEDEKLNYMDTGAADELFALADALFGEAAAMTKQGKKMVLGGDNEGAALLKKANKYSALASNLRNRTMVREGKW